MPPSEADPVAAAPALALPAAPDAMVAAEFMNNHPQNLE